MEQHRTITFEGKKIHYRDEGRGHENTLVLLHGFLQNLDVWNTYTLTYMRTMRVVSIDLPGHGYSDCYSNCHTMEFMAECVKAVLNDAEVDQCVMIGHSMGGYVALSFAEKYPYCLRGLGLINSHAFNDTAEKLKEREQACVEARENRVKYILSFIGDLFDRSKRNELLQDIKDLQDQCLNTSIESIEAAQRGMAQRPSRIDTLENLQVPVLFIFGKNDTRLPIELALLQTMAPQHSEVMIIDNMGHEAFMESEDYVKVRMKNFIETCYM